PGEAARLLGWSTAEVQAHRPRAAAAIAARRPAVVVLKGARTLMASPGRPQRLSPVVDGALAAGGTGDVLAGITGALLAARRPPATVRPARWRPPLPAGRGGGASWRARWRPGFPGRRPCWPPPATKWRRPCWRPTA